MKKYFNGLTTVNVELTSVCNKNCWMCGRRKIDRDYPEIAMNYGHMDFKLVKKIAKQLPDGIVVQMHNNGEPLLYPRFGDAMRLFNRQTRCTDTNGKLLVEKVNEIIGNLETITISVIENDPDGEEQYELVNEFLSMKGDRKPTMIYRCLGVVDVDKWKKLPGLIVKRVLHDPMGSFNYKKEPVIPEIGICWEILGHMAINRFGEVSMCVRFDPKRLGVMGNINEDKLIDIWNGEERKRRLNHHIAGDRCVVPLCFGCDFWGVPRG